MFRNSLVFNGTTSNLQIPGNYDGTEKVIVSANQNVNVWVSYSNGWYIHVSDSSFVGNVYYTIEA